MTVAPQTKEANLRTTGRSPRQHVAWEEWKKRFGEADDMPTLMGLLHSGFGTVAKDEIEQAERVCTYLDLADGWGKSSDDFFRSDTKLKTKAFRMVAEKLFGENDVVVMRTVCAFHQMVAEKLLWFFRPGLIGLENLSILAEGRHAELARKFLQEFCEGVWEGNYSFEKHRRFYPTTQAFLESKRPDVLKILHAWDKQKFFRLFPRHASDWALLTDDCLKTLEELALKDSNVKTLEEALVAGSPAACLVVLARTAHQELERQKEIADAIRAVEEGKDRLKRLKKA